MMALGKPFSSYIWGNLGSPPLFVSWDYGSKMGALGRRDLGAGDADVDTSAVGISGRRGADLAACEDLDKAFDM